MKGLHGTEHQRKQPEIYRTELHIGIMLRKSSLGVSQALKISSHQQSILWFNFLLLDLPFQPHNLNRRGTTGKAEVVEQSCVFKSCTDLPLVVPWLLVVVLTSSFLKHQVRGLKHLQWFKNSAEGEVKRQLKG